jgi:hypothetical protein
MAMLGDILAAARRSAGAVDALFRASDGELAGRLAEAAADLGMSPAAYARMAVADFARFAGEEDWATLVSSLRESADPGTVCLLAMVHWRLTAAACADHGSGGIHLRQGTADERSIEQSAR